MSDKEINIAILQELKRIANEIFTNEIAHLHKHRG